MTNLSNDSTPTTATSNTGANTNAAASATVETVEHTLENLVAIGRVWANHGLSIGRSALEASVASLRIASQTLAEVQSRVNDTAANARSATR